ncbi:hypothetical protein G7062_10580 [Erysipelothrix sp. HDW6C]|uniref:hypothetical protein n=1 Tax=Erysipelothrix sp. HDW6C TaxID=2714930 RepID=UPI0014085886|nr:hypothetical protein [Erysipelothrix sp. HDW6C]QIK70722.1 hypothetical protein G7062_10580 [Erysipelothrix sp. HDW6C]
MSKKLKGELSLKINEDTGKMEEVIYGRPTPVRNLKRLMSSYFNKHRFVKASWSKSAKQMEVNEMVESYLQYVAQHKMRKYTKVRATNKTYEAIQGWNITLMIDHHLDDLGVKKFADKFMDILSGGEKLGYVVFEAHEGEFGRYLHIWVCDYEFTGKARVIKKRYERAAYRNKITKTFCKKDDPNAECIYKAGDVVKDKNGEDVEVSVLFGITKCVSLAHEPKFLYHRVRQCIIDTYASLQATQKPVWRFKRFHIWWSNHAKLNKIYADINRKQKIMEHTLMYYLEEQMVHDYRDDDFGTVGYASRTIDEVGFKLTKAGRELKDIYYQYYGAFKNYHFTDSDGTSLSLIDTRKGREALFENIQRLWNRFKLNIQQLVKRYDLKELTLSN